MKRKRKGMLLGVIAGIMLCTSMSVNALAVESYEVSETKIYERDGYEYSEELLLVSYADPDDYRTWDSEHGYFDEDMEAKMKAFIESEIIKGAATDYEKAHRIFDWIFSNLEYAYDLGKFPYIEPWDVFTYKVAVCGGYSNLYRAMLNSIGIPSVLISGDSAYGAHIWNAVYADGRWFHSDSTWGGEYFDMELESFLADHRPTKVQAFSLETEDGILIGYDQGVAVVGLTAPAKTVTTPDTYRDMYVTSISIGLYRPEFGVETVNVGPYIRSIDTQITSRTLKAFNVSKENEVYASKDGVLFSRDMKSLLYYPENKQDTTFVLPKETLNLDLKAAFGNAYLKNVEVEEGNTAYASYEGALYDIDGKELLMVPAGKTDVYIWGNASINSMAFANVDTSQITIYGEENSPAQKYAQQYQIRFVSNTDCSCEEVEEEITKATTKNNGQIVIKCKECQKVKETKVIYAVDTMYLSQTEYEYDGKSKMPEVTVKDSQGTVIDEKYYEVRYAEGCTEPGKYTVSVSLDSEYYSGTLMASYEIKAPVNPFTDVKEEDYFCKAVLWAVSQKITSGYTQTVFAPHATCTRAEVVTFLWREAGSPLPKTSKCSFEDVEKGAFYYNAVLWAVENGITKGISETVFAPNETVTRGQFVSFLYRGEGRSGYAVENPFSDVKEGNYYYDAVLWAYENGITAGYQNDEFAPEMGCTRCQVVSFLYRNR